ncbi:MAG: hypothetical protein KKE24_04550 [Candidatus Thermoplasmatota archaeon]|nr:hypothetical protein [Candidatus Thermoplasmatota archaeon]
MKACNIEATVKKISTEPRTKKTPWKQWELKKLFGEIPLRQPADEVLVFNAEASLGRLWLRNGKIGYAYEAWMWVGYPIEVDDDTLEHPGRILLELELSKLKNADIQVDVSKVNGEFVVGAGPKRNILFVSKRKPGSE